MKTFPISSSLVKLMIELMHVIIRCVGTFVTVEIESITKKPGEMVKMALSPNFTIIEENVSSSEETFHPNFGTDPTIPVGYRGLYSVAVYIKRYIECKLMKSFHVCRKIKVSEW